MYECSGTSECTESRPVALANTNSRSAYARKRSRSAQPMMQQMMMMIRTSESASGRNEVSRASTSSTLTGSAV
jgi:hypothetical protein